MSENTADTHHHTNYVTIWKILLVLLVISVVGPMLEIKVVTLITAFGIAIVKGLMVAGYFMHLNIEKKYIWYLLLTAILFLFILFFGLAPDILNHEGTNWVNNATEPMDTTHADH